MTYKEIVANYKSKKKGWTMQKVSREKRIKVLERKLKWNNNELKKLWDSMPHWIDEIVFPFLAEVNKLLPEYEVKGESVTFGLNCQTPVHVTKNGETVFFSHLEPGADGLLYHTQKVIREHPYGNDYETKEIESVEQYAEYIKQCIKKEKQL